MIDYCQVCKKDVELRDHFCPYCGRNLFARKNRVKYGSNTTSRINATGKKD